MRQQYVVVFDSALFTLVYPAHIWHAMKPDEQASAIARQRRLLERHRHKYDVMTRSNVKDSQ